MSAANGSVRRTLAAVLLGVATAAAPAAAGRVAAMTQPSPASFRTIEKGAQSNIDSARQVVIRSAAEWAALWKTHNFDKPAPRVDFDKDMVVGVFMGSRPTGGFSTEITSVADKDGAVVVTYRETSPRPDAMTVQVLTFPYHLVATAKRAGEVRFEKGLR